MLVPDFGDVEPVSCLIFPHPDGPYVAVGLSSDIAVRDESIEDVMLRFDRVHQRVYERKHALPAPALERYKQHADAALAAGAPTQRRTVTRLISIAGNGPMPYHSDWLHYAIVYVFAPTAPEGEPPFTFRDGALPTR